MLGKFLYDITRLLSMFTKSSYATLTVFFRCPGAISLKITNPYKTKSHLNQPHQTSHAPHKVSVNRHTRPRATGSHPDLAGTNVTVSSDLLVRGSLSSIGVETRSHAQHAPDLNLLDVSSRPRHPTRFDLLTRVLTRVLTDSTSLYFVTESSPPLLG